MNLVTGATGHVGNVLVRKLLARGEQVRALVLPGECCDSLSGLAVELVAGSVLDPDALGKAMAGVETVYHLAGVISIIPGAEELMHRVNVEGTRNTAAAALKANVRRMVHTSSVHAFRREPHGVTITEATPLDPDNPAGAYDRTKAAGTLAVLEAIGQGLDAVIVYPTGIIGPYDYRGSEMGQLISSFAARKLHFLVSGAFDFVDVRDVARGMILAAQKGRRGEAYIFSGKRVTLEKLRQITQEIAGIKSPLVMVPFHLALFFSSFTQHFYRLANTIPQYTRYSLQTVVDNSSFSNDKARLELGFAPLPLEKTIADTLSWRREYFHKYYRRRGGKCKFRLWRIRNA
jgi:dihydroflavonol-4-reductase